MVMARLVGQMERMVRVLWFELTKGASQKSLKSNSEGEGHSAVMLAVAEEGGVECTKKTRWCEGAHKCQPYLMSEGVGRQEKQGNCFRHTFFSPLFPSCALI